MVSVTLSKILEYFMLDRWTSHEFSKAQYGVIKHRGTDMATALAHDIGKYCNASGSCVFYCSLDVKGTFDGLSHAVILNKAMDVIPEFDWKILQYWYSNMVVTILWNGQEVDKIKVECGTRQGGLTSRYPFNLFYCDLIKELNQAKCGVTIANCNFNAFCYADDVLL